MRFHLHPSLHPTLCSPFPTPFPVVSIAVEAPGWLHCGGGGYISRVAAALRGVGMDVASARVDEPVPPPDTSGLLDGALPAGTAGGEDGRGASGAAPGGEPAADVVPVFDQMPVTTEEATDASGSGSAAVPPPESSNAGPTAEATSPTAGEVGLCTLRCLLANSTEFRMSAPPETIVRDVKTQILTQQPPRTLGPLRGYAASAGVVHVCFSIVLRLFVSFLSEGVRTGLGTASIGYTRSRARWRRECWCCFIISRAHGNDAGDGCVQVAGVWVMSVCHFVLLLRTAPCGSVSTRGDEERCSCAVSSDDPFCSGFWRLACIHCGSLLLPSCLLPSTRRHV